MTYPCRSEGNERVQADKRNDKQREHKTYRYDTTVSLSNLLIQRKVKNKQEKKKKRIEELKKEEESCKLNNLSFPILEYTSRLGHCNMNGLWLFFN